MCFGFVHDVVDDDHDGDKGVNLHTHTPTNSRVYMCTLTHVNKRDASADAAQAILCLVALNVGGGRLSIGQPIKICAAGVANNIHEQYIILRAQTSNRNAQYLCLFNWCAQRSLETGLQLTVSLRGLLAAKSPPIRAALHRWPFA